MGRRLNISQPTVIKTELMPLTDMFDILASDTLEQWYYVNSALNPDSTTSPYNPDRTQTPLILTPTIKAVDEDSGTLYTPSFEQVVWYYFDPTYTTIPQDDDYWPGRGYRRVTAVRYSEGVDYYVPTESNPDRHLVVTKNVPVPTSTTSGQPICCVATYIDPRDSGVTYMVRKEVLLVTNQDATVSNVTISLLTPTSQKYNVFTSPYVAVTNPSGNPRNQLFRELSNGVYNLTADTTVTSGKTYYSNSLYTITAQVLGVNNEDVTSSYYIEWKGIANASTEEVLINTLPCYTQAPQPANGGQGKASIRINALFVEKLDIVCRVRKTSTSAVLPAKEYTSIVWDLPNIDATTVCKNGSAVNSVNRNMNFQTIANIKGRTLTDAEKLENLFINYKRRISTSSTFVDMGWGQEITVPSSDLKQTTSYSTPVHSEVYLIGAYDIVKDDNETVTDDGEVVYDRS